MLVATSVVLVATAAAMPASMSGTLVTSDTRFATIHAATPAATFGTTAIDYSVAMPVFTAVCTPVASAHAASFATMLVATRSAFVVTPVVAAFDTAPAATPTQGQRLFPVSCYEYHPAVFLSFRTLVATPGGEFEYTLAAPTVIARLAGTLVTVVVGFVVSSTVSPKDVSLSAFAIVQTTS